jgi:hypothetical protein
MRAVRHALIVSANESGANYEFDDLAVSIAAKLRQCGEAVTIIGSHQTLGRLQNVGFGSADGESVLEPHPGFEDGSVIWVPRRETPSMISRQVSPVEVFVHSDGSQAVALATADLGFALHGDAGVEIIRSTGDPNRTGRGEKNTA